MSDLFQPAGKTVRLDVTAANGRVALPTREYGDALRIVNDGDATAFIAFGTASVTAAIAADGADAWGMPIGAGRESGFTPPAGATHLAAICAATKTARLFQRVVESPRPKFLVGELNSQFSAPCHYGRVKGAGHVAFANRQFCYSRALHLRLASVSRAGR